MHNDDGGMSGSDRLYRFATLILTSAQGDPGKEMWTTYMEEYKEYDERVADAWKQDAKGLLVFVSPDLLILMLIAITSRKTGLFSAIVGAFIIESYKSLSPDTGNQTVVLLEQISQQLAGSTNASGSSQLSANQPFSPSAPMILVNAMWLISLMLSITSALFATLLQQWARRYAHMPQIPSEPHHRARVRSFLFFGTQKYKMRFAVETAPTLLHISVFLFFIGLVIFFFTINKTVAIIVLTAFGLFSSAYFILTILPCIQHNCPYRTPISNIWWYISHGFPSFVAICFRWLFGLLHGCLVPDGLDDITSRTPYRQKILHRLWESWDNSATKHRECLKVGFGKSIIKEAVEAPVNGDRKMITEVSQKKASKVRGQYTKRQNCRAHDTSHRVWKNRPPRTPPRCPTKLCSRHTRGWTRRGCAQALPLSMFICSPSSCQGFYQPRRRFATRDVEFDGGRADLLCKYRSYASNVGC